jgi:hypothetical protein
MEWHAAAPRGTFTVSLGVSILFAAGIFLLASVIAGGRTKADLQ